MSIDCQVDNGYSISVTSCGPSRIYLYPSRVSGYSHNRPRWASVDPSNSHAGNMRCCLFPAWRVRWGQKKFCQMLAGWTKKSSLPINFWNNVTKVVEDPSTPCETMPGKMLSSHISFSKKAMHLFTFWSIFRCLTHDIEEKCLSFLKKMLFSFPFWSDIFASDFQEWVRQPSWIYPPSWGVLRGPIMLPYKVACLLGHIRFNPLQSEH